jgi:hypothetical protein
MILLSAKTEAIVDSMGDFKNLRAWREAKQLASAQGYLTDSELAPLRTTRANCARLVYGLLRKMSDQTQ